MSNSIDLNKFFQNFPSDFTGDLYKEHGKNIAGIKNPEDVWRGAVCCLLVDGHFLFIKRSQDVPSHKGQIAFLGGHREEGEHEPSQVAAREFEEEAGIDRSHINFQGYLPPVYTKNNAVIIPSVFTYDLGIEKLQSELVSNGEWDHSFLVHHHTLANEALWRYGHYHGEAPTPHPVLYRILESTEFQTLYGEHHDHHFLWGATARMVWNFYRLGFSFG